MNFIKNLIKRLMDYLKSSRLEFKYVNWPKKKAALRFTLLVIAVSAFVAVFLGFLDILFTYLLNRFII